MTDAAPPDAPPERRSRFLPGLALTALLGAAALAIAEVPWVKDTLRVSALLVVIVLGMAWRALLPLPDALLPGIRMSQRAVLRWAVAGLGFRLIMGELWALGVAPLVVVVVATVAALLFGWWAARRLGVPESLGLLLGVGGAVCGASAIVAADTVVHGERRDSAVAIGIVTLLGTLGMVLYPLLQRGLGIDEFVYGVWDGASLHEMAHVVAAGFGVSEKAGSVATVVKLARICLLAPVVLYLGWSLRDRHPGKVRVSPVPWFLVMFVLFAALNSTGLLPASWTDVLRRIDLGLLCMGMAGVGLQTGFSDLKAAGARPLVAATLQWLLLASLSFALAAWLCR